MKRTFVRPKTIIIDLEGEELLLDTSIKIDPEENVDNDSKSRSESNQDTPRRGSLWGNEW